MLFILTLLKGRQGRLGDNIRNVWVVVALDHVPSRPMSLSGPRQISNRTDRKLFLEMLAPSHRSVPAPREGLTVLHVLSPTVPYYRS
jgi:hypothetical protein